MSLKRIYLPGLLALIIFGLIASVHGTLNLMKAIDTKSWPSVEGLIANSELKVTRSDGKEKYRAVVEYVYSVDGIDYKNTRTGLVVIVTERNARDTIIKYPKGGIVEVYYNPQSHSDSLLYSGVSLVIILYPILGGLFILCPLIILGVIKRRET